jgi:murein DD-endopeptidase MepM/ murein hydrolase activator NlpD
MVIACLISAREYYVNYQIDNSLTLLESGNFNAEESSLTLEENNSGPVAPCNHQPDPSTPQERVITINKGATLKSILKNINISNTQIEAINKVLKGTYNPRDLKAGQTVSVKYNQNGSDINLIGLAFKPTLEHEVIVKKMENGGFKAQKVAIELKKVLRRFDGKITSNFYNAALKLGIPANIVKEAVKALSYTVNFQHGINSGAPFELLYEEHHDAKGTLVKTGNLKYISVIAKGQLHRIYSYAINGNTFGYYNAKGENVVRNLLQNPIDSRRIKINSGFGNRMHPIRGFTCKHKGVDFGAAHGTAVMSAGDGVIVKSGYYGAYGNHIRIRHSGGYETVYAHLSKISPNVRPGAFVKQGEVIGNVGSTGSATGAHLHHEVIYKNVHINPLSVKALPTTRLAAKDIQKFNKYKQEIETQIVGLPMKNQLASSDLATSTHG